MAGAGKPGKRSDRREQRSEERHLAVLRLARLVTERGEQLCRIRDISPGGFMAEAAGHYVEGEPVTIELRSGRQTRGHIVWADDGRIGATFELPVDPQLALQDDGADPPRLPRIRIDAEASLCLGRVFRIVRVEDVSLGGLSLTLDEPDCEGLPAVVTLDGLPPMPGFICWQLDGKAGIVFGERLSFETLSAWLARRLG